jgi:hypothetical protein
MRTDIHLGADWNTLALILWHYFYSLPPSYSKQVTQITTDPYSAYVQSYAYEGVPYWFQIIHHKNISNTKKETSVPLPIGMDARCFNEAIAKGAATADSGTTGRGVAKAVSKMDIQAQVNATLQVQVQEIMREQVQKVAREMAKNATANIHNWIRRKAMRLMPQRRRRQREAADVGML